MKIETQINRVLEQDIRPLLLRHGGDIQFVEWQDGVAYLELKGACSQCASADTSTKDMIVETICGKIAEVKGVEFIHSVSPELMDMARQILNHKKF